MPRRKPEPQAAQDPPDAQPGPGGVMVLRERPSKSALKRQMTDLQKLGEAVAGLPDDRLRALDLPETLHEAIVEWRRTRSFEGRRRQMQYVGKLMRQIDDTPLREAVAAFELGGARDTLQLHEAELWRQRLVAGDEAITEWMAAHPGCDAQRLRQLVRRAREEQAAPEGRQARAFREIFQMIKPFLATEPPTPEPAP